MSDPESIFLGKYVCGDRLGCGTNGLVYQVSHGSDQYAAKLERASKKTKRPPSEHEANVLKILADPEASPRPRIPRLIDTGYDKEEYSNIIILDLLGTDIDWLKWKRNDRITVNATLQVASQIIPTIRYIHSKNFVHRDIKPSNMTIGGRGEENKIYMIDFGLARLYRDPENTESHLPFIDKKHMTGTVRYASLNTHLGIAQTRRDDMESLAYSLLDCMRALPWANIIGGNRKQFHDRVREKKRSWTAERLCAGLPEPFGLLLAHARGLEYDEEPNYDLLQASFLKEMESRGLFPDGPINWSSNNPNDYAPSLRKPTSVPLPNDEPPPLPNIQPGDLIKLRLLGLPSVLFSGRFDSIRTDISYWISPSLDGKEWEFPYRPAIVSAVERSVVRKGRRGLILKVYPLMCAEDGLDGLPQHARKRFVPLNVEGTESAPRALPISPSWSRKNTYVYVSDVAYRFAIDPCLLSLDSFRNQWHVPSEELKHLWKYFKSNFPSPIQREPSSQEDRKETIELKRSKQRRHLMNFFAEALPLTPDDFDSRNVLWRGRRGWMKEFYRIAERLSIEMRHSASEAYSTPNYDTCPIFDSFPPTHKRRHSCTIHWNHDAH